MNEKEWSKQILKAISPMLIIGLFSLVVVLIGGIR